MIEIKSRYDGSVIFTYDGGADLSGANLSRADLSGANLSDADLSRADLSGANLSRADLSRADLSRANLSGANLSGADLSRADLSRANLSRADLSRANLSRADLSGANLSGANLSDADLSRADLSGANLSGVNLSGVNIDLLQISRMAICPQEGEFIGWKKLQGGYIAKLKIPEDALRMNSYSSRKCRASKVIVIEIFGAESSYDKHTGKTLYKADIEVIPDSFNGDRSVECANGIHFFITKEEAEAYE